MARRHIMTLRVGREFIIVETVPDPPRGYQVTVSRNEIGLAPALVFDAVYRTAAEASTAWREQCTKMVASTVREIQTPVEQRPSRIVQIEEEAEHV